MVVKVETELVEHTCITCGIVFAFPENYDRWLRETHKTFYCPNGHNMYFPQETEAEQLRKKARFLGQNLELSEKENRELHGQLDGALQSIGKMKKRVNAGVCPHCHRHFANVERHIRTKHKDKL